MGQRQRPKITLRRERPAPPTPPFFFTFDCPCPRTMNNIPRDGHVGQRARTPGSAPSMAASALGERSCAQWPPIVNSVVLCQSPRGAPAMAAPALVWPSCARSALSPPTPAPSPANARRAWLDVGVAAPVHCPRLPLRRRGHRLDNVRNLLSREHRLLLCLTI